MSDSPTRTLLITGTTGIAAATAEMAAGRGWTVHVLGRDPDSLTELASTHPLIDGDSVELTDPAATEAAVERAVARLGRVDALFAVAGISGRGFGDGPVDMCTDEGWGHTITGNLDTTFFTTRAVLRHMLEQPTDTRGLRGSIVHMGSILATHPEPELFATHAYAAAKGAIASLTMAMAARYANQGIRVNAVAPGLVRTPMSLRAQSNPRIRERLATLQPLGGDFLEPEEVAEAALFLLDGTASGRITGQILAVDAGWGVRP